MHKDARGGEVDVWRRIPTTTVYFSTFNLKFIKSKPNKKIQEAANKTIEVPGSVVKKSARGVEL